MKKSKFGNVVLCERVMMGEHKKHILLNTYSGDVIVNDLPANLQFGLYIEIYAAKNGQDTVKMELLLNDKVLLDGQADIAQHLQSPASDDVGLAQRFGLDQEFPAWRAVQSCGRA